MARHDTSPQPGRPGRILRLALVASLAVNLLVGGVVVGKVVTHGFERVSDRRDGTHMGRKDSRTEAERDDDRSLRAIGNLPFVMALPRESRAELADALRREAGPLEANRARLRARFEDVLAVLRAEPFDPDALRDLLGQQRAALFERQQFGETLLIDHLSGMSAEARAAYADRLDRSLRRGPPDRK